MARQNAKDHRREQILTDDEIRAVWQATGDGSPFSALIQFLLLTSARRNEAAGMRWDEVDTAGVWTLPASRSKTKVEVVRPLSAAALAVLDGLPRIDGCDYPFTSNGSRPIRQFSDSKRKLDEASGVSGWRLHDLRRSARSLLAKCKDVSVDHAERVLGHALPGVRATYDRHTYADEIRYAVEALSALVDRIIHPPAGESPTWQPSAASGGVDMPRKTNAPPTVAEVQALWRLLSAADQAEFRRRIGKRRSRWDKVDALMLLVYDLYRERYGLRPVTYFKWIGALLEGGVLDRDGKIRGGKIRFGPNDNAAWRRLYRKYTTGDYEKLARPAWFDDPKLMVLPPPSSLDDPRPPAIGYFN